MSVYRITKGPKPEKKPVLLLLQKLGSSRCPPEIDFSSGRPPSFLPDKEYPLAFGKTYPKGHIGFLVREDDPRRQQESFAKIYETDAVADSLKVQPKDILKPDMLVVIRRRRATHSEFQSKFEIARALVTASEGDETGKIGLFLPDNLLYGNFSREDLYYSVTTVSTEPYLAVYAKLEGFDFFDGQYMLVDYVITGLVTKHLYDSIKVRFTRAPNEEVYKARVLCHDSTGNSVDFNELVLDKLISIAAGEFPEHSKSGQAKICHAESNGDVFVQLDCSLADHVTDWLDKFGWEEYNRRKGSVVRVQKDCVYIAVFEEELYRVKVLEFINEKTVCVRYLDYGNKAGIPINTLVLASHVDPILPQLPALCHQVRLKWIDQIVDMDGFSQLWNDTYEMQVRREMVDGISTVLLFDKSKDAKDPDYYLNRQIIKRNIATKIPTLELKK